MERVRPGVSMNFKRVTPNSAPAPVGQIAVVVHDLERALDRYWRVLGIGPWSIYTYGPAIMREMTYMGQQAEFTMRLALAQAGGVVFELIQHLDGDTIYKDFLDRHGEGLHHMGVYVPDLHLAIEQALAEGYRVLQSGYGYGKRGDGGFAYLSTSNDLGAITELIEVPAERRGPERVYPEG
jgi:catechol 2,3-dioxygenase-like lactoylglutathione lyase family enzyme